MRPLFFILAIAVLWLMNRASTAAARNRPRPPPPMDETERTRRVREEVLRKIRERQVEQAGRPIFEPQEAEEPDEREEPEPIPAPPVARAKPAPAPQAAMEADQSAALAAAQRKIVEQLRALEQAELNLSRARSLGPPIGSAAPASPSPAGSFDLKRAIVWREILGPPVGLR